jgi:hypothetical protein
MLRDQQAFSAVGSRNLGKRQRRDSHSRRTLPKQRHPLGDNEDQATRNSTRRNPGTFAKQAKEDEEEKEEIKWVNQTEKIPNGSANCLGSNSNPQDHQEFS